MSTVLNNNAITIAGVDTSAVLKVFNISAYDSVSIQLNYTVSAADIVLALYESNDEVNLVAISGKTVEVTASGTTIWDISSPSSTYLAIQATATSGSLDLVIVPCFRSSTVRHQ